jgi:hypothetical protein
MSVGGRSRGERQCAAARGARRQLRAPIQSRRRRPSPPAPVATHPSAAAYVRPPVCIRACSSGSASIFSTPFPFRHERLVRRRGQSGVHILDEMAHVKCARHVHRRDAAAARRASTGWCRREAAVGQHRKRPAAAVLATSALSVDECETCRSGAPGLMLLLPPAQSPALAVSTKSKHARCSKLDAARA